jgi:transposase-like protein
VKQAFHCVNALNNILNDVILLVMFLTIYVSYWINYINFIAGDFKNFFISLDDVHKQHIINELIKILESNSNTFHHDLPNLTLCPHCESEKIRGNCFTNLKVQKYFFNTCKKNFSNNTTKVWCWVKKKIEMKQYMYCLLSGYSIRKSAAECGISINTTFI